MLLNFHLGKFSFLQDRRVRGVPNDLRVFHRFWGSGGNGGCPAELGDWVSQHPIRVFSCAERFTFQDSSNVFQLLCRWSDWNDKLRTYGVLSYRGSTFTRVRAWKVPIARIFPTHGTHISHLFQLCYLIEQHRTAIDFPVERHPSHATRIARKKQM